MKTTICIFEDNGYKELLPLTFLRPVYNLKCGIFSLRQKIIKSFNSASIIFHARNNLKESLKERYPKIPINDYQSNKIIFINGRLIANDEVIRKIKNMDLNTILINEGNIVAAKLDRIHFENKSEAFENRIDALLNSLPSKEIDATLVKYPWDLVNRNGDEIINDFKYVSKIISQSKKGKLRQVELANEKQIYFSRGVDIDPFVFLDATDGPIFIGKNVKIMSHTFVQGPAYIGDDSTIKAHTSIYHSTRIGQVCKIGGEIESSIIHSFTNKQHEGYLGHSYLGSWINIGASTNNSNLKNNYSNIAVLVNGKNLQTNSQFIGLIMGDHSKTAINTMLNTGTIVGISCNIFGSGFPPRYIPSFSWGGSEFLRSYDIEKSLEVARIVLLRRNVSLSIAEEKLLRIVFEETKKERVKKV